jgi:DNA-directed RNA polymerase subunit A"
MTEIPTEIRAAAEESSLPKRLRDELYSTLEERDVTVEQASEILQATVAQYEESRVDPLDPVGTISAQSIGEPGTQMSIVSDERVLLRREDETTVTEIGPLVDELLDDQQRHTVGDHEVARAPTGLEVLSLRADEQVEWKPVDEISRHEAPEELLEIELDSGRTIQATKSHSFVKKIDGDIVPVAGDTLAPGDELPVVGRFDSDSESADFDSFLSEHGRTLTDGGLAYGSDEGGDQATAVGTASWERIASIEAIEPRHEYVYDFSVAGLETFTTAAGVVTHNTMNTFHYAGVAEIDVTQGLPRLIELVDARKEPDTPMMTVYLEEEYAEDRDRAHEVVWNIEATRILQLGDVSTNVADMLVEVSLNEDTLRERWPTVDDPAEVAEEIAGTIESALGVEARRDGLAIRFGPDEPSYRDLLQLVEELREIVFKGIEDISRVVIRKEETDNGEEFVLYTEGSDFGTALEIEGVDASRTTCNNIHEIHKNLGVEAARESIIEETMDTLREQGLDDVNIRHLMLVADTMTNEGEIDSIGRHGISGAKDSVLARAAFEVTVSHLLDAAIHGEIDHLDGVTENVIVGKPIKLGTGDVDLRMSAGSNSD